MSKDSLHKKIEGNCMQSIVHVQHTCTCTNINSWINILLLNLFNLIRLLKKKKRTSHSNSHCSFESPPGVLHMKPET